MDNSSPDQLFYKYLQKTCTAQEEAAFRQLLEQPGNEELVKQLIDKVIAATTGGRERSAESSQAILEAIFLADKAPVIVMKPVARRTIWPRIAVAASILIIIAVGVMISIPTGKRQLVTTQQPDVAPGAYKAKLTLADGHIIMLDSALAGELAHQGNIAIVNKNGQLVYDNKLPGGNGELLYNTVATAMGETYSFILADGSQVWLNSASSIRFPVYFPGKERRIVITGEAYFKVAKNPQQPFIVSVNGMDVEALGTEFNINAYADEPVMTATLVEGSVKVTAPMLQGTTRRTARPEILKPGQQFQLKKNNELQVVNNVSVEEVTGWKEGFFHYESAGLPAILRQFARWYDVEVVYEGKVPDDTFFVIMNRSSSLTSVLQALKAGDVRFRIEGKKLIVQSTD